MDDTIRASGGGGRSAMLRATAHLPFRPYVWDGDTTLPGDDDIGYGFRRELLAGDAAGPPQEYAPVTPEQARRNRDTLAEALREHGRERRRG
jgi:hypothetical protein